MYSSPSGATQATVANQAVTRDVSLCQPCSRSAGKSSTRISETKGFGFVPKAALLVSVHFHYKANISKYIY